MRLATVQKLVRLLGERLRLAQDRSEAEFLSELHHRDRRPGHSLHPRPLEARECAAGHRHARMARLDHRAAEDHRSARQSDRSWRQRIGCLPRRDPVDAGLRILRQADLDRLGHRSHRAGLDRADEAPWLHQVRRAGRRLGRGRRRSDGRAGAAGTARHSHQHGRRHSSRHRQGCSGWRSDAIRSLG